MIDFFNSFFTSFLTIFQENPIAQSIGFVAVAVNIVAFATSKDKKFLVFMAISSLIWGIHFCLMGLLSAAGVSLFDVIKNIIALKYKRNLKLMLFFLGAYLLIWILTFDSNNLVSLIPIVNSLLSIYFIFYLKEVRLKLGFLLILFFRFSYNYLGHSLWGMMSDTILFFSWIYWIYRILQKKKKLKK